MAFATENECDIVMANDPDADRLGVLEKESGQWTAFTGNQIGTLLGHWLWETIGKQSDRVSELGSFVAGSSCLHCN